MSVIDSYVSGFQSEAKERLLQVIALIRAEAPEAVEKMAYGIPTWFLKENLVHVAAYEKHIGWYPTPGGIEAFKEELKIYKHAKGSVQFPHDQPLPLDLIQRMVRFRLRQVTHG